MKNYEKITDFKSTLQFLRKKRNLTQGGLGAVLGYGHTAICSYETGRTEPCINDLIRLADFFGVSVDFMVGHRVKIKGDSRYFMDIRAMRIKDAVEEMLEKVDMAIK
ncbi:helix-turn-helix domain-containing protein [Lachnospiraceae bacterium NSJ-143]|nr:helix-turn-helix domain-containing protein [Lachnospiraceae bacterium NSJ-143]